MRPPSLVVPLVLLLASLPVGVVACTGDDPVFTPPSSSPDGGSGTQGDSGTSTTNPDAGSATGDAAAVCTAPLADCNNDGTCDTSLDVDPKNCGACGHDCGLGATCVGSACQPATIAKNLTSAVSLAVNASAVVVLSEGGPWVCPKDGCGAAAPTSLFGSEYFPAGPHTIYVDAQNAYWLGKAAAAGAQYELRKCAVAGCGLNPVTIDDAQLGSELRGSGDALLRYDPTGYATKIYTDGIKAKEYFTIATIPSSLHFALAGGKMAFSNTDGATGGNAGVWVGDFTNTAPTRIMNIGRMVAIGSGNVYASRSIDGTYDAIYTCAFAGCGGVGQNLGGTGTTAGTGKIADMIADASGLYWVESVGNIGRVMRCALPDCAGGPKPLAVAQDKPASITTDDKFVYWVNAGSSAGSGAVLRVAK